MSDGTASVVSAQGDKARIVFGDEGGDENEFIFTNPGVQKTTVDGKLAFKQIERGEEFKVYANSDGTGTLSVTREFPIDETKPKIGDNIGRQVNDFILDKESKGSFFKWAVGLNLVGGKRRKTRKTRKGGRRHRKTLRSRR